MFTKLINLQKIFCFALVFLQVAMTPPVYAHEDIELQINSLTETIKATPDNGKLYLKRAELHRLHQSWDHALLDYNNAENHGIKTEDLFFYRGRMYFEAKQIDTALLNLNAALKFQPNHVLALIERAKIPSRPALESVRDLDRAIGLSARPTPDLFLDRAKLLSSAGADQFNLMLSGIQAGITQLGPVVSLIDYAVEQSKTHKQWETALRLIGQLPPVLRQSPKWLYTEGQVQSQLQKNTIAKEMYSRALKKIDELPAARANSNAIIQLKKDIQAALR